MSRKLVYFQLLIIGFSCLLVACASTEDRYESAGDPVRTRSHDCISQSSIRDYRVLDDRNLIVTASGKRRYHVELSRPAFGLRSNWQIGFRTSTGQVCTATGDLLVEDGFGRLEAIPIASIRLLEPDEIDDLLIRFGKKAPEEQQAPAEQEVTGAEVEELD